MVIAAILGMASDAAPVRSMLGARSAVNAATSQEVEKPYWGLCFTAEEPDVVINMSKTGNPPAVTLETSRDGVKWTPFDAEGGTTPITLENIGDYVYFRATSHGNITFANGTSSYHCFTLLGYCAASGNIMSLINGDVAVYSLTRTYNFYKLFSGCGTLTSCPELPATQLAFISYGSMFQGCTSITYAPALPATNLSSYSYQQMFKNCSSLTNVPILLATSMAVGCYQEMFQNCTSLERTTELPSITLNESCYRSMFQDCTSLKTAPNLCATNLANNCYTTMFSGCTSLTNAPSVLPATSLKKQCYYQMFAKCKNLVNAPSISATSLNSRSCFGMFDGCSNLSLVTVAFTNWVSGVTDYWIGGVKKTGTFRCPTALGTQDTIERGTSRCPVGWTVENTD